MDSFCSGTNTKVSNWDFVQSYANSTYLQTLCARYYYLMRAYNFPFERLRWSEDIWCFCIYRKMDSGTLESSTPLRLKYHEVLAKLFSHLHHFPSYISKRKEIRYIMKNIKQKVKMKT